MALSRQAENSIRLYRGQDANQIVRLLSMQRPIVVSELHAYFGTTSNQALAIKLSSL